MPTAGFHVSASCESYIFNVAEKGLQSIIKLI